MAHELLSALGLVFVIEGLIWALFPGQARKIAILAAELPEGQMRVNGVAVVALGVLIVWLVRG